MGRKSAPRAPLLGRLGLAGAVAFVAACGGQTPANLVDGPTQSPLQPSSANPSETVEPTPLATEPPDAPSQNPVPSPEASRTPQTNLAIKFTSMTSPVQQGDTATAKVKTKPRAKCSIDVEYKSGQSTAAGLKDKTANSSGVVTWSWTVGINTSAGKWPVTVSCSLGGAYGSATKYFTVR